MSGSNACPCKDRTTSPELGSACASKSQCNAANQNDSGPKCPVMSQIKKSINSDSRNKVVSNSVSEDSTYGCPRSDMKLNGIQKGCCACGASMTGRSYPPQRSASITASGQDTGTTSSATRKCSNISTVSSSGGSEETEEGEKKLDLRGLIESVGTLLIPVVSIRFIYSQT